MVQEVLISISLIVGIAAIVTVFARFVKQPPIIAYLIAGVIVGPMYFNLIGASSSVISTFAHIGVALLLFIVGLSLDFRVLREIGKVATLAGIVQVLLTAFIGYAITLWLGFSSIIGIYVGIALAFSSTVVVVKILADKKEIETLHGKIALGILIVQDFLAALALVLFPIVYNKAGVSAVISKVEIVGGLIIIVALISIFLVRRVLDYVARNQEALFLFGIAWALILASLFDYFGFSLEIGALIAGITLASSKYTLELGGKIKPLRDFFVVLFFVFLGSQLVGPINWEMIKYAVILSAFVLLGKPLIVMAILRIFGYKKRVNFFTGISLAQVSEFSMILMLLGYNLGHISQEVISLMVLVAIITIGISSYGLYYAHFLFNKFARILSIFEGKRQESKKIKMEQHEIILFGYHRIGYKLLKSLNGIKDSNLMVVDYNPKVILSLAEEGIGAVYGDGCDKEFLSEMNIDKAKLIISTVPDEESNLTIREFLKNRGSKAVFIATAEQPRQALELYEKGIDYVIVPHHLGGDLFSTIIKAFGTDKDKYHSLGKQHYSELKKARNNSNFM
ncbi:MAG: cation:proton antiporter family protein [Nanoarchaeota archaeon]